MDWPALCLSLGVMVHLRSQPGRPDETGPERLNLLLSYGGWREESWADLLPRMLDPLGVRSLRADSAASAADLIRRERIHIAVVDLCVPLSDDERDGCSEEGGARILDLLNRLETPPPTVVVKRRKTRRDNVRETASALRAGAFAVIERPVKLELVLETMRRVLRRHYADRWPDATGCM